jgi:predicted TIM-barrel fold metal-dependent hydrolase
MVIDAHYHLDERLETVDRLLEQMDRHGIDRIALIAAMVDPLPEGLLPRTLAGVMRMALTGRFRGLGVRLYRSMVRGDGKFHMLHQARLIYAQPDNGRVEQVMRRYAHRFYGWVFVNPLACDALAEVGRWAGRPGWIGVKAHPFWHRYPVALLDGIADFCVRRGWPLLVSLGPDRDTGDYRRLPERYPDLRLVYAHAGVPYFGDLWEYARTKPNLFVDLSGSHLDERLRLRAVRCLGPERCLYGTDGPYLCPDRDGRYDHGRILQEIRRLPLSGGGRDKIMGGNFHQLIALAHVVPPR